MEKCCRTCRFYNKGECNGNLSKNIAFNDVSDTLAHVIEEGILDMLLREELNYKEVVKSITDKLKEKDILKKTKIASIKKLDFSDEEEKFIEHIDSFISTSLSQCLDNNVNTTIDIQNPDEFYCSDWR